MGSVINGKQDDQQKQRLQTSQVSTQGCQGQDQEQDFFTKEIQERKKQIEEWNKMTESSKQITRQQSEVQKPQVEINDKKINHANKKQEQTEELVNLQKDFNNDEREFVFGTQKPGISPYLSEKNQIQNNPVIGESPIVAIFDQLPYKDVKFLQILKDLPKIIQEMLQGKGLYKPKELKKNEKIVVKVLKQPDGSLYEGELENNQRHGYGMFWNNDEFYEGYFEKNERKGWGRIINLNKELKSGYWEQKLIQREMYYETDQVIYDGQCRNNLPHGRGILERKGQFKYEGTFSDGKLSGQGIKKNFVDKTSYEGEFYNDVIQGYGTFKFSNGKRYQGQFLQNKFHENGEMFWPDGRYYKGEFLNNFRHGQGYYRFKDGSTYEGGWINEKKHGMGKVVINGLELVGQWIDDVFQEE